MRRVPDDDSYSYEDDFLGRHIPSDVTPWQKVAMAIFIEAATCLRKDEETREHLKAKQWITNRNYGFEYWSGVLGADPDVLREQLVKGLLDPEKMKQLKGARAWFRRVQANHSRRGAINAAA